MPLSVDNVTALLVRHEDSRDSSDDMELFRRSYVGGAEYRDGDYLLRHEKEKKSTFKRRVREAVYTNYCAPVIDIFNSYLFRERPQRTYGAHSKDSTVLDFIDNADMQGRSLPELMVEVNRWASVYGYMGVVVDKPQAEGALTRADELNNGVRPYLVYYTPSSIVNWKYTTDYRSPPKLSTLVLKEREVEEELDVYKIWRLDSWELWSVSKDKQGREQAPEFIMEGVNNLGYIPFTLVVNKDAFDEMSGVSDLTDLAEINRYIYRLDSLAYEVIAGTAFPFLEVPVDSMRGSVNEDVVIGTSNVLERDITDGIGHRWIEPAHASLGRIMEWRQQAVNDMREIAKMGTGSAQGKQGSASYSGVAMEVKFQQLNAILSSKATGMERAEENIIKNMLAWEKLDTTGVEVRYPRKFGIRDVVTDLDTALRAKEVIHSHAYDTLIQKSLASRSLSDLGYAPSDIEIVTKQIEAQPYVPSATEFRSVSGMNGVSVVQTTNAEQQQQRQAKMVKNMATNTPQ